MTFGLLWTLFVLVTYKFITLPNTFWCVKMCLRSSERSVSDFLWNLRSGSLNGSFFIERVFQGLVYVSYFVSTGLHKAIKWFEKIGHNRVKSIISQPLFLQTNIIQKSCFRHLSCFLTKHSTFTYQGHWKK